MERLAAQVRRRARESVMIFFAQLAFHNVIPPRVEHSECKRAKVSARAYSVCEQRPKSSVVRLSESQRPLALPSSRGRCSLKFAKRLASRERANNLSPQLRGRYRQVQAVSASATRGYRAQDRMIPRVSRLTHRC